MPMLGVMADAYKAPAGGGLPVAGAVGWWDASDTASITASGGAVSQWNDKSTNAKHVTQGTAAAKPTTGTATINGRNVLVFDGGDVLNYAGSTGLNIADVTAFAVFKETTAVNNAGVFVAVPSTGNDQNALNGLVTETRGTADHFGVERNHSTASAVITGTSASPLGVYVGRWASDLSVNVWRDGVAGTGMTSTSGTFGVANGWLIGGRYQSSAISGSFRLNGQIAEIIVYNTALSTTDRQAVEAYLMTKWGIGAFTPTQIAGLQGWWDASDAASITSSAGAVSQWNDKSTNVRHVVQATGANQPLTAVNTMNGKNVLTFDGTNDCLVGPVAQLVNATTGEWSAFSVHKPSNVTGVRNIFDQDKGSAPKTAQFLRNNATASNALAFNTTPTAFVDVGTTITINTAAQYSGVRTATTVELWVNGTSGGSTATTGTPSADGTTVFSVGRIGNGAQFWAGDIAEVLVYNAALSTTDRQAVEAYLKAKWGTP